VLRCGENARTTIARRRDAEERGEAEAPDHRCGAPRAAKPLVHVERETYGKVRPLHVRKQRLASRIGIGADDGAEGAKEPEVRGRRTRGRIAQPEYRGIHFDHQRTARTIRPHP
jgi:hypothetical protein